MSSADDAVAQFAYFPSRQRLQRQNSHMVMNGRLTVVATFIGAATIAAVVGCSSSGPPASSGTTAASQSASPSSRPAVTSAAPQAPKPGLDEAAGGIDVTIAAQGSTTVRPGGPPMRFSVALVNT